MRVMRKASFVKYFSEEIIGSPRVIQEAQSWA